MKVLKVLILGFLLIFFAKLKAEAISISPHTIVLTSEAGKEGVSTIKVYNEGKNSYKIKAYAWDIGFDKNGARVYKPIGSFNYSTARYIKVTPENFTIKSLESKDVKVSISTPAESYSGGHQAIVFFEVVTPKPNEDSSASVSMGIRLGALILQETKGTLNVKSRISEVLINTPIETKPLSINMRVINEGNTHIFASATVAIMSQDYKKFIGKFNLKELTIFPNKTETISGEWKGKISSGVYHALITYQYGKDKNVVIDKVFEIK